MKRGWEPTTSSGFDVDGGSSSQADDSAWVHMPSHPYASAYSSIPNPFQSSPLPNEQSYEQGFSRSHVDKKSRMADMTLGDAANGSEGSDGDDDDEDDDEDDAGDEGRSTPAGKAKGGKGAKAQSEGKKPKAKLTRGSRACIAWVYSSLR